MCFCCVGFANYLTNCSGKAPLHLPSVAAFLYFEWCTACTHFHHQRRLRQLHRRFPGVSPEVLCEVPSTQYMHVVCCHSPRAFLGPRRLVSRLANYPDFQGQLSEAARFGTLTAHGAQVTTWLGVHKRQALACTLQMDYNQTRGIGYLTRYLGSHARWAIADIA